MRDRALFIFWAVSEGRLAWSAASADTRIFHWTSHKSHFCKHLKLRRRDNIVFKYPKLLSKLTKLVKVIDISKISSPTISIDKKALCEHCMKINHF